MTNREIIEYLKDRFLTQRMFDLSVPSKKTTEVIKMAIEALEKQIPKKPIEKDVSENIWDGSVEGRDLRIVDVNYRTAHYCPSCGSLVFECDDVLFEEWSEEVKFCDNCGQALDWSEE